MSEPETIELAPAEEPTPKKARKPKADSLENRARLASDQMRQLGDRTRMWIMLLLESGRLYVGQICDATSQSQSAISNQLSLLKLSGLIDSEREGQRSYYSLTPKGHQLLRVVDLLAGF